MVSGFRTWGKAGTDTATIRGFVANLASVLRRVSVSKREYQIAEPEARGDVDEDTVTIERSFNVSSLTCYMA